MGSVDSCLRFEGCPQQKIEVGGAVCHCHQSPMDIRNFFGKRRRSSYEGHDTLTEERIRSLCSDIADDLNRWKEPETRRLFVPRKFVPVYTTHPVRLADDMPLLPEFLALWKKMWKYGFALYGFELYLQPDGRVALLNFEKTCFRQTNPELPSLFQYPFPLLDTEDKNSFYFKHPCFPPKFVDFLVGPEGGWEAQLKRIGALQYKSYLSKV